MMKYDNLHNITSKKLGHTVFGSYPKESNYELEYQYSQERPHQLSQIKELTVTAGEEKTHKYSYDPNGNMVHRQEDIHYRSLTWDEENRLMGVNDEGYASRYVYDDTGERVLKSSGGVTQVSVNGTSMGTMEDMKNYTGYLSPYFVFKEGSFTKHIYAGTERIVSQIGNGEFNNNSGGLGGNGITAGSLNFAQVQDWYEVQKEKYIASLGVPPGPPDKKGIYASPQYTGKPWPDFGSPLNSSLNTPPKGWPKMPVFNPPGGPPGPPVQFGPAQTNDSVNGGYGYSGTGTFAEDRYFYHHDHLGSSSYLTNQLGNITQHVEYIPFGEVFVEERNEKWNTPYLFNGKELDEETGLYYYGARYYDSKISLWLSVDPLATIIPTLSPYSYVRNNPTNYIDPYGLFETKKEAKEYRKEHGINGKIQRNKDGSFSIDDRKNGVSYTRIRDGEERSNTTGADGVEQSALVVGERDKISNTLKNIAQANDVVDNIGNSLESNAGLTRIGSNSKLYFETSKGGVFKGNQYVKTASLAKYGSKIGRVTGPVGHVVSAAQIVHGVHQDDWQFGYNAQVATAGVVGGMAGAWAGAEAGALVGGKIGAVIGACFGGVGAAPGAVIGGFIGGVAGGIAGGYYGGELGEQMVK